MVWAKEIGWVRGLEGTLVDCCIGGILLHSIPLSVSVPILTITFHFFQSIIPPLQGLYI